MKKKFNWKQGAIVATVLVFICAGLYLNWSFNRKQAVPTLSQVLNEEQVLGKSTFVLNGLSAPGDAEETENDLQTGGDYFATVRLSRQQSRDQAVTTLQESMAYEDAEEGKSLCAASLDGIVNTALNEAEIESLVIAKGYKDCVTYIADDVVSVAVSAPAEGLKQSDVALISDVVTTQTGCPLSDVRIIEVK